MGMSQIFDALLRISSFISTNGVSGVLTILWAFTLAMWWLERDERRSAQRELAKISLDTVKAIGETAEAMRDQTKAAQVTCEIFEKLWTSVVQRGKAR